MTSENLFKTNRKAEYPVDESIINRWSPRAMSGESIDKKDLMSLFEAARWAPSEFNSQPWRFIFARRDSEDFEKLLNLLTDSNRLWAKRHLL